MQHVAFLNFWVEKMEFQKVLIADMIQVRGDYFQREMARQAWHRTASRTSSTAALQDSRKSTSHLDFDLLKGRQVSHDEVRRACERGKG